MEKSKDIDGKFKKPILIGKIGKLPRKVVKTAPLVHSAEDDQIEPEELTEKEVVDQSPKESAGNSLTYKEPEWSGIPGPDANYGFDVLKSGKIIESIDLSDKAFWVFGRLGNCDMIMAHPTISRYHAVLQYRNDGNDDHPEGFYLYDLGSTHGTFVNKNRLKTRVYARVQVGHMIKLGCSSRTFILTGPEADQEIESDLTVTELKQKRIEDIKAREDERQALILKSKQEKEDRERKEEERGIDWGMGEDADEATDLSENPYAQTNNEELYLDDPKKTLRGFMEREGVDFEYVCTEQGMGQFLCKVELPIDDEKGRPIMAEALHKGKKKEAVVQCALEACRILDRHGLLRQATHVSRKRKMKNWEENDYYDSDDDTFLDRTGSIEKKRENRMKAKAVQSVETYESLLDKEKAISLEIRGIEKKLREASSSLASKKQNDNEDSLDAFMKDLSSKKLDKHKISELKIELARLKKEHANVLKLVNIAKPADLPPLKPFYETQNSADTNPTNSKQQKGLPLYGKRMKVKVQLPEPKDVNVAFNDDDGDDDDDNDDEEAVPKELKGINPCLCLKLKEDIKNLSSHSESDAAIKTITKIVANEEERVEKLRQFLVGAVQVQNIVEKQKIDKSSDSYSNYSNTLHFYLKSQESSSNSNELQSMEKHLQEFERFVKEEGSSSSKSTEKNEANKEQKEDDDEEAENNKIDEEKRRKRNQRRIQQRQGKMEIQKVKGYDEDSLKEDYNMWVPPSNQTGDGRTRLNDKLGY